MQLTGEYISEIALSEHPKEGVLILSNGEEVSIILDKTEVLILTGDGDMLTRDFITEDEAEAFVELLQEGAKLSTLEKFGFSGV